MGQSLATLHPGTDVLCFLDSVDFFFLHMLNPTNQKAQLSFEPSASLGLIRRGRQQVRIEICKSEVGSASELIITTELALFPCPVGRLVWASLMCVCNLCCLF